MQPLVREVTLADSSAGMLEVAREKIAAGGIPNARNLWLDLAAGGRLDLRFDLVCTLMTLHHLPDTDGILAAFRGLLNEGGVLCISDLDRRTGPSASPRSPVPPSRPRFASCSSTTHPTSCSRSWTGPRPLTMRTSKGHLVEPSSLAGQEMA